MAKTLVESNGNVVLLSVEIITPQSQVRIRPAQLEPHGSETTRPWVFFCAGGETERLFPWISKGLREWDDVLSLSSHVARDLLDSHIWPSDAPIPAQTLGRLSVSRRWG